MITTSTIVYSLGQHAKAAGNLGKVATRDECRRLVADTQLEASWAPVDELDRAAGLDGADSGIGVLRHHIATVEQATGHVLALTRVALDHLVAWLEAGESDLRDGVLFVRCLLFGDDGGVGGEREVDTREGHQVGLELIEIDIQGAIEPERSGDT